MKMKRDLPILWWMDANDLKKVNDDGDKLVEIVEKIKDYETGRMTLSELQDQVEEIINRTPKS